MHYGRSRKKRNEVNEMPLYDFECRDCGHRFEELVARDYQGLKCPRCGSQQVARLMSRFSSRVSGGWTTPTSAASSGGSCGSHGFS